MKLFFLLILLWPQALVSGGAKIETVAGTGVPGFSGDNGPAVKAQLNNPYGLAVGPGGALFVCDMGNDRIRRIDTNGTITTVAGRGTKGWRGDGGPALAAALNEPYEVRFDRAGNMFFVEMRNAVVRRVDSQTGIISTIAGTGKSGFSGDGAAATNASLNQPHSLQFVDSDQSELWICDIGNYRIRAVNLKTGIIKTVGGTGEPFPTREGDYLAANPLKGPRAIDVDLTGNIWLALREGNAIYRIDASKRIWRAAGNGSQGFRGNGGPALGASLSGPKGITIPKTGASKLNPPVIWADTESHTIRFLDASKGTVELLVGTGQPGNGPDGDALACELSRPHGVFADDKGNLWISDSENHRILRLKLTIP